MVEVKDEILAEEPKYRIYDKNGNILFDDLIIEQITPVIQEGTQLNKVLFDSIKNDINLLDGNLSRVDKYNIPIIEKSQENFTIKTDNIIPTSGWTEVKKGTEYTNGNMRILASGYADGNLATHVVDNNEDTSWESQRGTSSSWMIDFGEPIEIQKIKTRIYTYSSNFEKFEIYGHNDGDEAMTQLYSSDSSHRTVTEISLNATGRYRYYTVSISTTTYDYGKIAEFQTSQYIEKANVLVLDNDITEYVANQRILLKMPADAMISTDVYMNINNLGEKIINGELVAGEKYELIYNGKSFDAFSIISEITAIKNAIVALGGSV